MFNEARTDDGIGMGVRNLERRPSVAMQMIDIKTFCCSSTQGN
jgi:hypothetical protein